MSFSRSALLRMGTVALFCTSAVFAGRKLFFSISPDDSYGCIEVVKQDDPAVTICTSNSKFRTNYGSTHTLTAQPAAGKEFDHWEGYQVNGSTENPVSFQMLSGTEYITAVFRDGVGCIGAAVESGPVSITIDDGQSYSFGVTASGTTPIDYSWEMNDGSGWTSAPGAENSPYYSQASSSFENDNGKQFRCQVSNDCGNDVSATATLTVNPPVTYTLTISATGNGTTSPMPGTYTYNENEQVTITAVPDNGETFLGWSGALSGTNLTETITMDGNKTVGAEFSVTIPTYTLTISATGNGTTSPAPGTYTYNENEQVTITANPDNGETFLGWSGALSGTNLTETITMDGNKTVGAEFSVTVTTVPNADKLSISGVLYDSQGSPVTTSSYIEIKLYDAATSGTPLYYEEFGDAGCRCGVEVSEGRFVVRLGEGTTTDDLAGVLAAYNNLWVEVIFMNEVMEPRTPLTGSAYSIAQ